MLQLLNRPLDNHAPVVALDERPVQLRDSVRGGTPMAPGRAARRDYEYARCGTANVFCIVEPKRGRHHTHATKNRTMPQFAGALKRIAASYPEARTIHLIMDNLNTHQYASRKITHRGLRPTRGTPAVEALHRALHAEARQLAQSR